MFIKKQIFKINVLKKLLTDDNGCVSLVPTTRLLALPPFFLNDMKSGILYLLNAMLKKYDRSLGGIVIGYQNIKVLMDQNTGIIPIGTSETEVNISVEFYIFQPKIGSYLEGVINKTSNNHIGCLVHRYFNATILKPEDVEYDDWICKDFSVDDKVIFKVKELDFTTLLPYIEGVVDDKSSLKRTKKSEHCNVDQVMTNHVNKSSDEEFLFPKKLFQAGTSTEKNLKSDFLEHKKAKNRNEEEANILEDNSYSSSRENNSFSSPVKKKKKKKEKDLDNLKREEDKSLNYKEENLNIFSSKSDAQENHFEKKKKKNKQKHNDSDNQDQECLNIAENVVKEDNLMCSFLGQPKEVEDKNSSVLINETKSKKVKKKKKEKKDKEASLVFSKSSMNFPTEEVEDKVLYSTQIEPMSETEKMKMPFFSPIPVETSFKKNVSNKMTTNNVEFSVSSDNENERMKKKKKQEKRKREEKDESKGCSSPKKIKTSHMSTENTPQKEVNGGDKSTIQVMMEEMYKKLLNEAKEQVNLSDRDSSKVKKKKKESKRQEKKAMQSDSLNVNKITKTQENGVEGKSDVQSSHGKMQKEELNLFSWDGSEVKKKKKKKKTKKREEKTTHNELLNSNKDTPIRENGTGENSDVQNILDRLLKNEIKRVREDLNMSGIKNVKSKKRKVS